MMGLIVRESSQPIADGENADGNEMELEISKIFNALNGGLDDSNVKSAAGIVVSTKVADNSLPGDRFVDKTLTLTEIGNITFGMDNLDNSAAIQSFESLSLTGSEATTTSTSYEDIPNITEWTVTPHVTRNFLFMSLNHEVDNLTTGLYNFTFSVNGNDGSDLGSQEFALINTMNVIWAELAPIATTLVIKPRVKYVSGNASTWGNIQFSAMVIPIK